MLRPWLKPEGESRPAGAAGRRARWLRAGPLIALMALAGGAASAASLWTTWSEDGSGRRPAVSAAGAAFRLDVSAMEAQLGIKSRGLRAAAPVGARRITAPMPDGSLAEFEVEETAVLHPRLGARYPGIRTFVGRRIDGRPAAGRFDWTPQGFHAQIRSASGLVYVDPAFSTDRTHYLSYRRQDLRASKSWTCGVRSSPAAPRARTKAGRGPTIGQTLRTYRLALACTGEYAVFHGGGVENALGAMVTTVHRVNGIYESELAIRLQLIPDNDQLVFLNPETDPYTNDDADAMLSENTATLNAVVGSAAFDIGHVFSTGGGGLAVVGTVCDLSKAEGVTGTDRPAGDPFNVDFVAHEIGHQFGANHTFNGDSGSCAGANRSGSHAYEPGSGSTIMAYAGICGNDNLQPYSDPYFHSESQQEIIAYVEAAGGCAATSATANTPPTVDGGPDHVIPAQTPFVLTAAGSDPDGEVITYSWEARDLGPVQDINAPDNGSSPLFRSWSPTLDPARTFPRLSDVVSGLSTVGERLPALDRMMQFRVTVRDGLGGVASDDLQLTVVGAAGPFQVTSPNGGETVAGTQSVRWDPAGTAASPINATAVDIRLSTDGGLTYPWLLAEAVPNSGSAEVDYPNLDSATARLRLQGHQTVFFDVSDRDFRVRRTAGLDVEPADALVVSGPAGGPFFPACQTFRLTNVSVDPVAWTVDADQAWLTAAPAGGTLAGASFVDVALCVTNPATGLPAGDYQATALFSDPSGETVAARTVGLEVAPPAGRIRFVSAGVDVGESDGDAVIGVERVGNAVGEVRVAYASDQGSAVDGRDYLGVAGEVVWPAGEAGVRSLIVPILNDGSREEVEGFRIALSGASGGALIGGPSEVDVAILDDDDDDRCGGAVRIVQTPFTDVRDTGTATGDGDPDLQCAPAPGRGVWYRFVPPVDGTLMVDCSGSSYDTVVGVFHGACDGLSEAACDDDGGDGISSRTVLPVAADQPAHILVAGAQAETGTLVLTVDFVPVPDIFAENHRCDDAIPIEVLPFLDARSTESATATPEAEASCVAEVGHGVWYRYAAPAEGWLVLDLSASDFDTVVGVYTGSCSSLTQVACDDDYGPGNAARVNVPVSAGVTYWVLAGGSGTQRGMLGLQAEFREDRVRDPGFEAGPPWPAWTLQTSMGDDRSTPLCDGVSCGLGSGNPATGRALRGSNWALFTGANSRSAFGQMIQLPFNRPVSLEFGLYRSETTSSLLDSLTVTLDDVLLARYPEPELADMGYRREEIPLDAFADGNLHALRFEYTSFESSDPSVFQIDDVHVWVRDGDADADGILDQEDPDDDNDGIWDVWEWLHGLNLRFAADAGSDTDGDGLTARQEFLADTLPADPDSALRLRIQPRRPDLPTVQRLTFDGSPRRTYTVEFRTNLTEGSWSPLLRDLPGEGSNQVLQVPGDLPTGFYRLAPSLPPAP